MNAALPQKSWAAVASALPPDVRRGLCPPLRGFQVLGLCPQLRVFSMRLSQGEARTRGAARTLSVSDRRGRARASHPAAKPLRQQLTIFSKADERSRTELV